MSPRVLHLSTYDANGGAARAAYALHRAMLSQGVDSTMRVAVKTLDDPTVIGEPPSRFNKFARAQFADRQLWKLQKSPLQTWRSPARFGSLSADEINRSPYDVVNLHWVTDGFLSIEEIGKITKPVVWSMYDMWPFTGTEHYGSDDSTSRWRSGYSKHNREPGSTRIDLDRWTWQRKLDHWRTIHMIPASTWLTSAVTSSALMNDWPVTRIPHVVDEVEFAPMDCVEARRLLGMDEKTPTILFLASAGVHDHRKGFDLLERALPRVLTRFPRVQLAIVGPRDESLEQSHGVPIHWLGVLHGNKMLKLAYSAANVVAVPSREDNMPLTAMEAQMCGLPVVAFDVGGLPDIVRDQMSGVLVAPFDTDGLADALSMSLEDSVNHGTWGQQARFVAQDSWSPASVVEQYRIALGW